MSISKYNTKLVIVFISLIVFSIIIVIYKEPTKIFVRNILEWDLLNTMLWFAYICIFIVHYLSIKDSKEKNDGLIYKHFGKFADSSFAMVTYGLASTTSVAVLKGVYVQQYFGDQIYFVNFDDMDIYSMLVVSTFLLGYSIYAAATALMAALLKSKGSDAIPFSKPC